MTISEKRLMDRKDFKFIKGEYATGSPADIHFYTDVNWWSVENFIEEFDWLVNSLRPSKIRVHINSIGGNVVEGMSVFSKIMDCQIPTETIVDSLAASMGSIIWAAGDELYMKDYALLMIHNPFCDKCGEKEYNQATEAFGQQLKTIYMKRFGLSDEDAQAIMDGKEGDDGTFLTAQQAVERGFLKAENIVETPKAIKDQIMAALKDTTDIKQIQAIYQLALATDKVATINQQNDENKSNQTSIKMDKTELAVVAAIVGLTGDKVTSENVTAKINELKAKAENADALQKSLEETNAKLTKANEDLTKANAELTGAQTSINNLQEDLQKTKDSLKVYQDAEAKAKEDKVNALIDDAIKACKISNEERDIYFRMAQNDLELAENVLAKIPARDNIKDGIATGNTAEVKDSIKTEEQKLMEKVDAVVGKEFKFRTLS